MATFADTSVTIPDVQLRTAQQRVADYRGGLLAVPSVPGSGKTLTLSVLAASLLKDDPSEQRQILVVTYPAGGGRRDLSTDLCSASRMRTAHDRVQRPHTTCPRLDDGERPSCPQRRG